MAEPGAHDADGPRGGRRAAAHPILFIHVPKTAGTSMRHSLEAALGSAQVYPSAMDVGRHPGRLYRTAPEILREYASIRPHRVLIGHFPAGLRDELPVPHRTAVMLRDPVQRSLSLLAHMERHEGVPPATALACDAIRHRIVDRQTRIMASGVAEPHVEVTDATLARALRTLDDFDFVGLTERFEDSCRLFDATFGTTVMRSVRRSNVLRPGGHGFEEFIPLIEPLVARDRVLYERAAARFARDLSALPPAARTAVA